MGFNAVFNNKNFSHRNGGQFTYSCVTCLTPVLNTTLFTSNWLIFHIDCKPNGARRMTNDFCQTSERMLAELGFELTEPLTWQLTSIPTEQPDSAAQALSYLYLWNRYVSMRIAHVMFVSIKGMTFVSVFTLLLISIDRYWSVTWYIHYRQHHNKNTCLISIAVAW